MSELEYRGTFQHVPGEIVNSPEAQTEINGASQTQAQMEAEVKAALQGKATQTFVTNQASGLATPSSASVSFSNKVNNSDLGNSVAQLGTNGMLPTSYFPDIQTRGATFFNWTGTMTNKTSTTASPRQELARLSVSNPNMTYYTVWAWAYVEARLEATDQTPGLEITTVQGGEVISRGYAAAGYTDDWTSVPCVPVKSRYVFTGTTTLILRTHRAGVGSANITYSGYKPSFSALVVPVSYGT